MKIGFFGGTFSPIHNGHKQLVDIALKSGNLDKVVIIPNGNPPHKVCDVAAIDRYNMCCLAFREDKRVEVSDIELDGDAHYTVDTVARLQQLYSQDQLVLIVGGDSLSEITLWRNPQQLVDSIELLVVGRADIDTAKAIEVARERLNARVKLAVGQPSDISSTFVRLAIGVGLDVSQLVDSQVLEYIKRHNLYNLGQLGNISKFIDGRRLTHSVQTAVCGLTLCKAAKVDDSQALIACLLHDVAKRAKELPNKYSGISDSVVHSYIGADMAKEYFNITDCDILNSIRYHTTGRPNMSQLEKLVFVADKVNSGRSDEFRKLYDVCKKDFQLGFINTLKLSYKYVIEGNKDIDITTQQAIKYYCMEEDSDDK